MADSGRCAISQKNPACTGTFLPLGRGRRRLQIAQSAVRTRSIRCTYTLVQRSATGMCGTGIITRDVATVIVGAARISGALLNMQL